MVRKDCCSPAVCETNKGKIAAVDDNRIVQCIANALCRRADHGVDAGSDRRAEAERTGAVPALTKTVVDDLGIAGDDRGHVNRCRKHIVVDEGARARVHSEQRGTIAARELERRDRRRRAPIRQHAEQVVGRAATKETESTLIDPDIALRRAVAAEHAADAVHHHDDIAKHLAAIRADAEPAAFDTRIGSSESQSAGDGWRQETGNG